MSTHTCCQKPGQAGWRGRIRKVAGWLLPGTVLALMPKCPMCLAAYVALGTGITMSYASAHILMRVLTWLCISALVFCALRRMLRHTRQKSSLKLPSTHSIS